MTHLTGRHIGRAGQEQVVTTSHPFGQRPTHWRAASPTCNRSYLLALMRAGVIAAVLLGILALIILF